jgi:hypothetical protein
VSTNDVGFPGASIEDRLRRRDGARHEKDT